MIIKFESEEAARKWALDMIKMTRAAEEGRAPLDPAKLKFYEEELAAGRWPAANVQAVLDSVPDVEPLPGDEIETPQPDAQGAPGEDR